MTTHGTTTLTTPRLTLRRHILSDAPTLHRDFGLDPEMSRYSGWNPYATPEMAEETVRRTIDSYAGERAYSWAIEHEGKLIG
ncbi:MAG: GNAT family N-acetyltransferase, partial [Firmicutes bacterium]|nr:GNAT family N-acetyltransferase [Bacillota bacterium]